MRLPRPRRLRISCGKHTLMPPKQLSEGNVVDVGQGGPVAYRAITKLKLATETLAGACPIGLFAWLISSLARSLR